MTHNIYNPANHSHNPITKEGNPKLLHNSCTATPTTTNSLIKCNWKCFGEMIQSHPNSVFVLALLGFFFSLAAWFF